MRTKYCILLGLALLAMNNAFGAAAAAPIDFANAVLNKSVKISFDNPISLYQSTRAGSLHENKFFTARTLLRLGPEVNDSDWKAVRNEICASYLMYDAADNRGLPIQRMPGSLGVYLHGDRVVSVADIGMAGEPLDAVLRKLSDEPAEVKIAAAKYYAVAMTAALEAIQAGNVVWNNVSLRNFIVRPDGTLYAKDFSDATRAVGDAAGIATAKQADWKELVIRTINQMYHLLFPLGVAARVNYEALVTGGGVVAAAIPTTAWTKALVVAAVNAALLQAHDHGFVAGINAGGLNNGAGGYEENFDGRTALYLDSAPNIPYLPVGKLMQNIAKADHDAGLGSIANQSFVLDDRVRTLLINPATGLFYGDFAELCNTWTGR